MSRARVGLAICLVACGTAPAPAPRPQSFDPFDRDRDGQHATAHGGPDCDDADPRVAAGAAEVCSGRDEDCDGEIDEGFDCIAGTERTCGPIAGWRQDCSGTCAWLDCAPVDEGGCEGAACTPGEVESCVGACGDGQRVCNAACTWGNCTCAERCNGHDDDGDGRIDEGTWGLVTGAMAIEQQEWTMSAVATTTEQGTIAIARATTEPEVGAALLVSWTDADGRAVAPATVVSEEFTASLPDVVTVGQSIAVAYAPAFRSRVAVVAPEGVSSDFAIGERFHDPQVVWDGARIGVQGGALLQWFFLDGSQDGDEIAMEAAGYGQSVWSGSAVVLSDIGTASFVTADGALLATTELGADVRPALATDRGSVVAAAESNGQIELVKLTPDGEELWRTTAPADEPMVAQQVIPVDGGWLVVRQDDDLQAASLGGWLVDDAGVELRSPTFWTSTTCAWWLTTSGTAIGGEAVLAISFEWLGIARIGCQP